MITRLYVNNFRCLLAFEAKFGSFGLLCGPNGAGKSSVFDALRLIRNLATGDAVLGGTGENDIPHLEFTRWNDETAAASRIQEFELGLTVDGHAFEYKIHLEQKAEFEKPRIVKEQATCDGKPLFTRELDPVTMRAEVRFERADGNQTGFPLDWRQAALAVIQPRGNIERLTLLQSAMEGLLVLRPNPRLMEPESKAEASRPDLSLSNLTSWYRSLALDQDWTNLLSNSLQRVWPDFLSFKLENLGLNAKALQLRFEHAGGKPLLLFTGQLSDGERMLIALYMVHAALESGAAQTVFIDEPDNFVGLQELQPWVLGMRGQLDDEHQLVLISHHPEVLENSGAANGMYLWRDSHTSPTRIGPLKVPEGMTAGEAIARGWANGQ
jgi:predicted ATPase